MTIYTHLIGIVLVAVVTVVAVDGSRVDGGCVDNAVCGVRRNFYCNLLQEGKELNVRRFPCVWREWMRSTPHLFIV